MDIGYLIFTFDTSYQHHMWILYMPKIVEPFNGPNTNIHPNFTKVRVKSLLSYFLILANACPH